MKKCRKTIYLLAYYRPHTELFKMIRSALPADIDVKLKLVYMLTPASLLCSASLPHGLSAEKIDEMTAPYKSQKLRNNPELNTDAWQNKIRKRAIQWYHLFKKELKNSDMLVVWGGFAIPLGSAIMAARDLGIHTVICENGVLAGTIAMDIKGVNFNSSLTGKTADFYRNIPIGDDIDDLWQKIWPQRPLRKAAPVNEQTTDDDKPLPQRYLLYAMQVYDDSQIRLFSPNFANMFESVSYVYENINRYNAATGDDLCLVVKEHPSDYGRIDYGELRESMPDVLFLRDTPVRDAINKSIGVVTINSSVAVEALFTELPVITLGLAFYNIPGIVRYVNTDEQLSDILPSLLSEPIDTELRRHFLYFLWKHYLVPNPLKYPAEANRAANRLADILDNKIIK